jgi:FixJ family two-component response regulator
MDKCQGPISIVDDDVDVRRALGRMLKSHGFKVEFFSSASDYLKNSRADPACLILDVVMPDMNGFELLAVLKESGRNVPTVFLSARDNQAYVEQARLLGASAFLQKPCEEAELLEAIKRALGSNDGSLLEKKP